MRELAAGLLLAAALNAAVFPDLRGGAPLSSGRVARGVPTKVSADTAVETAAFLGLGLRRLAADLELIRMLVYYGSPEPDQARREQAEEAAGGEGEKLYGGGHYPEILPRALSMLQLDPAYSYPVLYAAGALAFNLGRPAEALDLLAEARRRDPDNLQYAAYVAAVGFSRHGDLPRALAAIEPTLARPDCPTMIKSMVAFMYRRLGRRADAIRVFRDILATSRDEGYRRNARVALSELSAEPH